jgi:hypothetical protein
VVEADALNITVETGSATSSWLTTLEDDGAVLAADHLSLDILGQFGSVDSRLTTTARSTTDLSGLPSVVLRADRLSLTGGDVALSAQSDLTIESLDLKTDATIDLAMADQASLSWNAVADADLGDFTLTSTGTQTFGSDFSLSVGGDVSLSAKRLSLESGAQLVSLTGGDTTLAGTDALTLGAFTASGKLSLTSTAGSVTTTGALSAAEQTVSITAATDASLSGITAGATTLSGASITGLVRCPQAASRRRRPAISAWLASRRPVR